jgi:hypothetical protein
VGGDLAGDRTTVDGSQVAAWTASGVYGVIDNLVVTG